ncbi:hypothetical protein ACWDNI_23680 [Nocardia niigatensis]
MLRAELVRRAHPSFLIEHLGSGRQCTLRIDPASADGRHQAADRGELQGDPPERWVDETIHAAFQPANNGGSG